MAFREELEALENDLNLQLHLVPTVADEGWNGLSGRVDAKMLATLLPPSCQGGECEIYVCGPPAMMDAMEESLLQLGVPLRHIHTERFNLA